MHIFPRSSHVHTVNLSTSFIVHLNVHQHTRTRLQKLEPYILNRANSATMFVRIRPSTRTSARGTKKSIHGLKLARCVLSGSNQFHQNNKNTLDRKPCGLVHSFRSFPYFGDCPVPTQSNRKEKELQIFNYVYSIDFLSQPDVFTRPTAWHGPLSPPTRVPCACQHSALELTCGGHTTVP